MLIAGNGNIGWNTLITAVADPDMEKIKVPVKTFDAAGIMATPTFIKIDVEGAEYQVLAGMATTLRFWEPLPTILCEIGWGKTHPDWSAELAAFDSLARLGYRFLDLDGNSVVIDTLNCTTDVLCLPASVAGTR